VETYTLELEVTALLYLAASTFSISD
jgi:hypothetical protein